MWIKAKDSDTIVNSEHSIRIYISGTGKKVNLKVDLLGGTTDITIYSGERKAVQAQFAHLIKTLERHREGYWTPLELDAG